MKELLRGLDARLRGKVALASLGPPTPTAAPALAACLVRALDCAQYVTPRPTKFASFSFFFVTAADYSDGIGLMF